MGGCNIPDTVLRDRVTKEGHEIIVGMQLAARIHNFSFQLNNRQDVNSWVNATNQPNTMWFAAKSLEMVRFSFLFTSRNLLTTVGYVIKKQICKNLNLAFSSEFAANQIVFKQYSGNIVQSSVSSVVLNFHHKDGKTFSIVT